MRVLVSLLIFASLAISAVSTFGQNLSSNVPTDWQSWGAETDWELDAIAKLILQGEPNADKFKGVLVLPLKEANAFINSDGFLIITEGLLEQLNGRDEVAFVIAHEVAHLIKDHPRNLETNPSRLERIRTEVERGLGTSVVGTGLQLLVNAVASYYSREREREADAEAVRLMAKAGFDTNSAKRVLENWVGEKGFISWFRSHPFISERFEIVDDAIRRWRSLTSSPPKLAPPPNLKPEVYVDLQMSTKNGLGGKLWQEFAKEVSKNFWSAIAEESKRSSSNFQPVKRWQRHRAEIYLLQVDLKNWEISPLPHLSDWFRWELRLKLQLSGKASENLFTSEERFVVTFGKGEQVESVVISSAQSFARRLAKFVAQNYPKVASIKCNQ